MYQLFNKPGIIVDMQTSSVVVIAFSGPLYCMHPIDSYPITCAEAHYFYPLLLLAPSGFRGPFSRIHIQKNLFSDSQHLHAQDNVYTGCTIQGKKPSQLWPFCFLTFCLLSDRFMIFLLFRGEKCGGSEESHSHLLFTFCSKMCVFGS